MPRESLTKLKKLVQELEDRDTSLKQDMSLLDSALVSFPIPVTMWMVDEAGTCKSCRVTGAVSPGWSSPIHDGACTLDVADLYRCLSFRSQLGPKIERALQGNIECFLYHDNDTHTSIWTCIRPRWSNHRVIGATGVSIDITSGLETLVTFSNNFPVAVNFEEASHVK